MNEVFGEIRQMAITMGSDLMRSLIEFTPRLIGAFLVLLVGWILAKVLRAVVSRMLQSGLDGLLERAGFQTVLERASPSATPSSIVGSLLYWLVLIVFVMGASQILGLDAVTTAITRVLGFVPVVVSAGVLLAAGVFLARFAGTLVTSGAAAANISYAAGLGGAVRGALLVMAGVVTMEQLGIDTQILITVITVSVAAIAAGMGLAFALGSQDVVRGILAGHYLRQTLPEGTVVEVAGERGVVEQIGPIDTVFRDGERRVSIPNGRLLEEVIRH